MRYLTLYSVIMGGITYGQNDTLYGQYMSEWYFLDNFINLYFYLFYF